MSLNSFQAYNYSINGFTYVNPLSAFTHAATFSPNEAVKFNFNEQFWDNIDWVNEPLDSFQSLMEKRALQIREKYDFLIFGFSGGTDSITIYEVFKKLKIKIDAIFVSYMDSGFELGDGGFPHDAVVWLKKNHYDPDTKIFAVDKMSNEHNSKMKFDPSNKMANQPAATLTSTNLLDYLYERSGSHNPGLVMGVEKPYIIYENNAWYVTHIDKVYMPHLFYKPVEWFYVSEHLPELHVKQTHMLLRACRLEKPGNAKSWNSGIFSKNNYYKHAMCCGRLGDLFPGSSVLQKKFILDFMAASVDQFRKKSTNYIDPIIEFTKFANPGYFETIKDCQLSTRTVDYMTKFGYYCGNHRDWNGIYSKKYKILSQ